MTVKVTTELQPRHTYTLELDDDQRIALEEVIHTGLGYWVNEEKSGRTLSPFEQGNYDMARTIVAELEAAADEAVRQATALGGTGCVTRTEMPPLSDIPLYPAKTDLPDGRCPSPRVHEEHEFLHDDVTHWCRGISEYTPRQQLVTHMSGSQAHGNHHADSPDVLHRIQEEALLVKHALDFPGCRWTPRPSQA